MIENIKLMTRSVGADYEYFGSPTQTDWLGTYQKCLFNDVSAFALSLFGVVSGKQWKVFLGRIPSVNRDSLSRQISYVVKAEGSCGNEDSKRIAKLLSFILMDDNNMKKTGEKFSSEFSFDYINSLDDKRHTSETESDINAKLENIFKSIDVNVPDLDFKADGLTFDYFSADNAEKVCALISKITDSQLSADENLFFAVTDLPLDSSDTDTLFSESQNANGIVLTTNREVSINLPVVKKKTSFRANRITMESPMKSRSGWTRTQKILGSLLIISLIINIVLIFAKPSAISESEYSAVRDSLRQSRLLSERLSTTLEAKTKQIDSLNALQFHNGTFLDLMEFGKSGICKTIFANKTDTVSVYSNVDFAKSKCEIHIYKNRDEKGGADVNLK